jgi:single-strand DNA-binding protein
MNDIMMTLAGNVCDEPVLRITRNGTSVTRLRLASTPRRYDRAEGRWIDGETVFLDVTCWRGLAEHVAECVHKGQPVLATGRFTAHTYEVNEQLRYAFRLEAASLGHDLSRGTAEFRKSSRASAPGYVPADGNGVPVDEGDQWRDFAESGQPAPVAAGLGEGASGGPETVLAGAG